MSDPTLEHQLDRQNRRRRKVVALAEELRALGAGDPFEGPVEWPEAPCPLVRYRDLVEGIHVRSGFDPEAEPLPSTYRYEWRLEKAQRIEEGGIVCQTPAGPCLVMPAGVFGPGAYPPATYPEEIHGTEEERDARTGG